MTAQAISMFRRDCLGALGCKAWTPEPTVHRRHRFVWRSGRYPGFHRQIVRLALKLHVRIMTFWSWQGVLPVDHVRRPARGLADAPQIALTLIVSLIHHHDSARAVFLDQP